MNAKVDDVGKKDCEEQYFFLRVKWTKDDIGQTECPKKTWFQNIWDTLYIRFTSFLCRYYDVNMMGVNNWNISQYHKYSVPGTWRKYLWRFQNSPTLWFNRKYWFDLNYKEIAFSSFHLFSVDLPSRSWLNFVKEVGGAYCSIFPFSSFQIR